MGNIKIGVRELEYLRSPGLIAMIKALILGAALCLCWDAWISADTSIFMLTSPNSAARINYYLEGVWFVLLVAIVGLRYSTPTVLKIWKSKRLDLFGSLLFGAAIAAAFSKAPLSKFTAAAATLSADQIELLIALPLFLGSVFVLRAILLSLQSETSQPSAYFISDAEKSLISEDLLNVREIAFRFSERVLNRGSRDSLVFGLDAPWGTGKSSFINFSIEYWNKHHADDVIIYRFNPLQYEDRSHLLQKFVDGLILKIKEVIFAPELQTVVSRYARAISSHRPFKFGGFEFDFTKPNITVEQAAVDIAFALSKLPRRLIVVVDDLDRMELSALKDILFVIKKGFSLPNVSFVLSYDTQNIAALEGTTYDNDKIAEFLEKFINVKISLFPSSDDLSNFVTDNLKIAVAGNLLSDFQSIDHLLGGLREIYAAPDYAFYLPLVGDVRKIKRILNLLMLLDIGQTDFKNSDFDAKDLVHLILIYINYPNLFRTIYNSETSGRDGFFSVSAPYIANSSPQYKNSDEFLQFLSGLTSSNRRNEKLLLMKLFDVKTKLGSSDPATLKPEAKRSYACFNSQRSGRRNLEAYLNLIVKVSKPPIEAQYRFYVNLKNRILSGEALESITTLPQFDVLNGEDSIDEFWRVLVNSLEEFTEARGADLIRYLAKTLPRHSALEIGELGIGLRHSSLLYTLLKLLDAVGWSDEGGRHRNNTEQNLVGITDWIYGTGAHSNEGILETLTAPSRGPIGLHDFLIVRLYSCFDRGGNLFNLTRAASLHSDPNAPTTGVLQQLVVHQMREMSQRIFRIFAEQYIQPRRNVFVEFGALSMESLAGDYYALVRTGISEGRILENDAERASGTVKNSMTGFVVYQLANRRIESGIGCGYYDEIGSNDSGGIARAMNAYFFGVCFAPDADAIGFENFVDHLLGGFRSSHLDGGGFQYRPSVDTFVLVLDRETLRNYWRTYGLAIASIFSGLNKTIYTANYTATYEEDLPYLFEELDKLLVTEGG